MMLPVHFSKTGVKMNAFIKDEATLDMCVKNKENKIENCFVKGLRDTVYSVRQAKKLIPFIPGGIVLAFFMEKLKIYTNMITSNMENLGQFKD